MKKVGGTVLGVKIGCHAFNRCCRNAVSKMNTHVRRGGFLIAERVSHWEVSGSSSSSSQGAYLDSRPLLNPCGLIRSVLLPILPLTPWLKEWRICRLPNKPAQDFCLFAAPGTSQRQACPHRFISFASQVFSSSKQTHLRTVIIVGARAANAQISFSPTTCSRAILAP